MDSPKQHQIKFDKYIDDLIGMDSDIKKLVKAIDLYGSKYIDNEEIENALFIEAGKFGDDYGYSEWEDSMKCNCSKKNKHIQDIEKIFIDIGEMDDIREIPMPLLSVYRAVINSLFYNQGRYIKLFILLIIDRVTSGDRLNDIMPWEYRYDKSLINKR